MRRKETNVFRHNLFRARRELEDDKTRAALAEIVREELESREKIIASNISTAITSAPILHGLFDAIAAVARAPAIKKRLASTTALWIRCHALGQSPSDWLEKAPHDTLLH